MSEVLIRKVKRSGASALWGAYVVEGDDDGVWLYTPRGSLYSATSLDGEVVVCHNGWPEPPGASVMHLIPTSGWWFARWSEVPPPLGAHLAIDVCTPSQFIDGIWTYDDLELDFVKSCGGSWQLIDQDEFDDEVGRGRVSIEESAAALRAVSELGARLDQHDEVFDTKGWDLLERCRRLEFPPIGGLS